MNGDHVGSPEDRLPSLVTRRHRASMRPVSLVQSCANGSLTKDNYSNSPSTILHIPINSTQQRRHVEGEEEEKGVEAGEMDEEREGEVERRRNDTLQFNAYSGNDPIRILDNPISAILSPNARAFRDVESRLEIIPTMSDSVELPHPKRLDQSPLEMLTVPVTKLVKSISAFLIGGYVGFGSTADRDKVRIEKCETVDCFQVGNVFLLSYLLTL